MIFLDLLVDLNMVIHKSKLIVRDSSQERGIASVAHVQFSFRQKELHM